jgi:hypothetical protein
VLITNHVLGGAVVGALSRGPATAFALGIASHVAMDVVPHWGDVDHEGFMRVAVPDGLVGLTLLAFLARTAPRSRRVTVVAGMLGACLPDADKPSVEFFGRSPFPAAVDAWHGAIQTEHADRMPQEGAVALAGLALATALLRRAGRRAGRSPASG